ncbi:MAG: hypothetical protein Q9182_006310 [Xanthomendoza sp. 2 TL-2023]
MTSRPVSGPHNYDLAGGHHIRSPPTISARALHTSRATKYPLGLHTTSGPEVDASTLPTISEVGIQRHLRLWQEQRNKQRSEAGAANPEAFNNSDPVVTRSSEDDAGNIIETADTTARDLLDADNIPGVEEDGTTSHHPYLRSGDVVAFRTQHDPILAIFTRNVGTQAQFYNVKGEWFHRPIRTVLHVIPRMFSLPEIEPILPYLPLTEISNDELDQVHLVDSSVPRSIGSALLDKLQGFHRESAEIYRKYTERIDGLHSLVAHDWKREELPLHVIASKVLQKPRRRDLTEAMLFTIHTALAKDSRFCPSEPGGLRIHSIWKVNPLKQVRDYEQVKRWLRDHLEVVIVQATSSEELSAPNIQEDDSARSNPISRFIRKARNLIRQSRVHREVTTDSSIGPRPRQGGTETSDPHALITTLKMTAFDAEERLIVDYLKDWALTMNMPNIGGTWSLGPMLLRVIGMYEGHDLNVRTGALLLKELGIVAPWENYALYQPLSHRLPYRGDRQALHHWNLASESARSLVSNGGPLEDALEGLRTDWGDMNVYCIDQAGTMEIDDGVSVEKIEGQDSRFWIHVHIANPTAFIKPVSDIAQYAAMLFQTRHLPEKVYPMLDPGLSQRYFSLANDRPVLTLSAKITTDGELLATKVTPGWVRKTKRITPGSIVRELGLNTSIQPQVSHVLTVGQSVAREIHTTPEETPVSTSEISELRLLRQLALARHLKRQVVDLPWTEHIPEPRVDTKPDGMVPTFYRYCGRQFIGDPTISWKAEEFSPTVETRRNEALTFVADLMLIAGEIAARWCAERNIPIPYRGTRRNPSLVGTQEAFRAEVLDPVQNEMGYLPRVYRGIQFLLMGYPHTNSSPLPHNILNVDAYAKATSPLRRYPDMIVHWQIQAALRHEAQHGQGSLIGSTDDSYLPFSRARIDAMVHGIEVRERGYNALKFWSNNHWIMQLLQRAHVHKQAPLPAVFDVVVTAEKIMFNDPRRTEATALVKQLSGIGAELVENEVSARAGGFRLGDWWVARIERVETGLVQAKLRMVPVSLTERVGTDILKRFGRSAMYRVY